MKLISGFRILKEEYFLKYHLKRRKHKAIFWIKVRHGKIDKLSSLKHGIACLVLQKPKN